jgi:hypothetical protein
MTTLTPDKIDVSTSISINGTEVLNNAGDGLFTGSVIVQGNLSVSGTTTTINSELQTADRYILLNSEYTGDAALSSGFVFNVDPDPVSFSIVGISSNVISIGGTDDPATYLAAGDFILIQGPTDPGNAGIFEVSAVNNILNTITIKTMPVEPFSGNSLFDDATGPSSGTVVGVKVAVLRSNTSGSIEAATGTATPLVYSTLQTSVPSLATVLASGGSTTSGTDLTVSSGDQLFVERLNVGPTTRAVAVGDFSAGSNGESELFFDESARQLWLRPITAADQMQLLIGRSADEGSLRFISNFATNTAQIKTENAANSTGLRIDAGTGGGNTHGASIDIRAASGGGAQTIGRTGGSVILRGGNAPRFANDDVPGASLTVGGAGGVGQGDKGGDVTINGGGGVPYVGDGTNELRGGDVNINGGETKSGTLRAGNIRLLGGKATDNTGVAGNITLRGGEASNATGTRGSIIIDGGLGIGATLGSVDIGLTYAGAINIGRSGITTTFTSGSTADFTGVTVLGLASDLESVLTNGNSSGANDIIMADSQALSGEGHLYVEATATGDGDLIFGAHGGSITLNEVGQENLSATDFGATSIIGALNELGAIASAGVGTLAQTLASGSTTGGTSISVSAGDDIVGSSTSDISFIGSGANSERFGSGAAANAGSTALGFNATVTTAANGVAIGYNAASTGGVAIGYNSTAHSNGTAVGYEADATSSGAALGRFARANHGSVVALGLGSISQAANQMIVGSVSAPIYDVRFNSANDISGLGAPSVGQFRLVGPWSGLAAADTIGTDFVLSSGPGRGTGTPGSIIFQTPDVEGAGTTLQTLVTRLEILEGFVRVADSTDLIWATDGGGNIGSGPTSLDNRPGSVWVKDLLQVGDSTVTISSIGDISASRALNIGTGVTPSTTNGDIRAGDGTSELVWANGSGGALAVTASGNVRAFQVNTNRDANNILGHTNSSTGTAAQASWQADCNGKIIAISAVNGGGGYAALGASGTATYLRIFSTGNINFRANGTANRWVIDGTNALTDGTSGHLLTGADNIYDIGASGATRPRTGYFGTSLNVGSGITPSMANGDIVAGDGTRELIWDASIGRLRLNGTDTANSGLLVYGAVVGGLLYGADAYNSDATNGARAGLRVRSDTAQLNIQALSSGWGGGLANAIRILSNGASSLDLLTDGEQPIKFFTRAGTGGARWQVLGASGAEHFAAGVDNTLDIGTSGALRPRTGYFGTALNVGNGITPSTANGDIVAGDGTNDIFYDASGGMIKIRRVPGEDNSNVSALIYVNSNANSVYHADVAGAGAHIFQCDSSGGTLASRTTSGVADDIFNFQARAYNGTGFGTVAGWRMLTDGAQTGASAPGLIEFSTTPSGSTTQLVRLTIDNAGVVSVGADVTGTGAVAIGEEFGTLATVKHVEIEVTGMSGASVTASSLIPAGVLVLGVSTRVTTAVTGASDFDIGDGVDVDRWGAGVAIGAGSTTDGTDFTDNTVSWTTASAGDVVLTANGSNFLTGAVRIVVTYMSLTAPTS